MNVLLASLTVGLILESFGCSNTKYTTMKTVEQVYRNNPILANNDEYIIANTGIGVTPPLLNTYPIGIYRPTPESMEFRISGKCASYDLISRESRFVVERLAFYLGGRDYFQTPMDAYKFVVERLMEGPTDSISVLRMVSSHTDVIPSDSLLFRLKLHAGGLQRKLNEYEASAGWTNNGELMGLIVKTTGGTYFAYLLENEAERWSLHGGELISVPVVTASAQMDSLFNLFIRGIRFDISN